MGNSQKISEQEKKHEEEDIQEMIDLMKDFGKITRITKFTAKEIIYLNNKFKELTGGERELTFERLSDIREFVSQNKILCKKLFNIFIFMKMDNNSGNNKGIGLLEFLRACSIFSRGSLEEQLPFLFIAMKDDISDYVTRESALNLAEMVKDAFQLSRKISRSGEVLGEAWANIDIVDEIDEKMFERNEKQVLKKEDFILKALSTPSALHCLSILERFFHPVTSTMHKKIDVNLNSLSLRFLVKTEKTRLPNAIKGICEGIEKQLGRYEKDMKRLYVEFTMKQDKELIDGILTSFGLGFTEEIDLNELNVVCLLHLLKNYLLHFNSPLFTFSFSFHFTSRLPDNFPLLCEELFKNLPIENYYTAKKILITLHKCCFKEKKLYEAITNFFMKCFFRFPENEKEKEGHNFTKNLLYSNSILKHFLQHVDLIPPSVYTPKLPSKVELDILLVKEKKKEVFHKKKKALFTKSDSINNLLSVNLSPPHSNNNSSDNFLFSTKNTNTANTNNTKNTNNTNNTINTINTNNTLSRFSENIIKTNNRFSENINNTNNRFSENIHEGNKSDSKKIEGDNRSSFSSSSANSISAFTSKDNQRPFYSKKESKNLSFYTHKKSKTTFELTSFMIPKTDVENEEKKINNKIILILQLSLKYFSFTDFLTCRLVNTSWNQISSNSKYLQQFLFVDFQLLLKWMNIPSKKILAEQFSWVVKDNKMILPISSCISPTLIRSPSSAHKNDNNYIEKKEKRKMEKKGKEDGGEEKYKFQEEKNEKFSISKLSLSNNKSHSLIFRHFVIAIVGSKYSGKSSFVSHLGKYIDFSDIRSTKGGKILEGNGKALDSAFSVCLVELEDSNSLFDSNIDELKNLSAAVVIASSNDKSFDSLSNLTKEKKVEFPVFHILNKIDTLSSEELKKVGVKVQTSDSQFSNSNFFPLSLKNQTNSEYFYFQLFKALLEKKN